MFISIIWKKFLSKLFYKNEYFRKRDMNSAKTGYLFNNSKSIAF